MQTTDLAYRVFILLTLVGMCALLYLAVDAVQKQQGANTGNAAADNNITVVLPPTDGVASVDQTPVPKTYKDSLVVFAIIAGVFSVCLLGRYMLLKKYRPLETHHRVFGSQSNPYLYLVGFFGIMVLWTRAIIAGEFDHSLQVDWYAAIFSGLLVVAILAHGFHPKKVEAGGVFMTVLATTGDYKGALAASTMKGVVDQEWKMPEFVKNIGTGASNAYNKVTTVWGQRPTEENVDKTGPERDAQI